MPHLKYVAYMAIICAVLLDLYSAKPGTSADMRLGLDAMALLFAVVGLGGLALGPSASRIRRR
jgi:cytochrome b